MESELARIAASEQSRKRAEEAERQEQERNRREAEERHREWLAKYGLTTELSRSEFDKWIRSPEYREFQKKKWAEERDAAQTYEELALLRKMRDWASNAVARPDAKLQVLMDWLRQNMRPDGKWSDQRVIIFTEYRATQRWLQQQLALAGFTQGDRLMLLYGGMDTEQRERIKAAFQYDPKVSPVRILLATDAASEGIDLQNYCSRLVHYEIPWNPNRMEQRNGRIDRHGQRAKEVHVYHFVGEGFRERERLNKDLPVGELEADLEFLMRAAKKVNQIREDLGKVGPVIAHQVEEAMLGRRSRLDTAQAESDSGAVRKMLKFERDLRAQIQRLRDQLNETQRELRLSPENVRKVVDVALELAGQPPLVPAIVKGLWPDAKRADCPVFHLPALKEPWTKCAEGLRHPHTGEIRPMVFDHHLAKGRDDVILVHLNHHLVQMCLRLLRAEVWSPESKKKLQRVAARVVPDTALRAPSLIAHARLVVIGGDSQRLHEEIITAGGLLVEGRFNRMNVTQVREALAAVKPGEVSAAMKDRLLAAYAKQRDALLKSLDARTKERVDGLKSFLSDREAKEASDIETILNELKRTIEEKLDDPDVRQMTFADWTETEQDQVRRNLDALRRRLKEIPDEIKRETAAVRRRFADPQPRMFPVAVTFLVPEGMR